jgi:murein DD-endopeptidase MepM/ murein hydrolase activator NlpD
MPNERPISNNILITVAAFALAIGVLPLLFPSLGQVPRFAAFLMQAPPTSLPVPVMGVKVDALADTWGAARSGGRRHQGIDIFARRNTPVLSVSDGVIIKVGWNALGGRVVMIVGPGGYRHYYAHLERFAARKEGDVVKRGDVVGYVGDSGNARGTPTHLHYGIYRFSGGAINPYPLLARKRGRMAANTSGRIAALTIGLTIHWVQP